MLVLGRKLNEKIYINGGRERGGITLVICRIGLVGGVRIGIDADESFSIMRGELLDDATTSPQSVSEEAKSRVQT
jgi:sRNA-binding carbon storage regulator CsrA